MAERCARYLITEEGMTRKSVGYYLQLGGVVAFAVGGILSLHHAAIGAAFVGGVVAFYLGEKIQAMS